jgi:hypothetical protein
VLRLGLLLTIVTAATVAVALGADALRDEATSTYLALAGIVVVATIWLCVFLASVVRKGLRLRTKPVHWGSDH